MGDPRKIRKKYSTPSHPWQKTRIEEENKIQQEYGTKNKKEIWKMRSFLQNAKGQAKKIVSLKSEQAEKEKTLLMTKLVRLGLLKESAELDDVLGLALKDILDRRLQTIVHKKNLAKTTKQARQFIVHGHIKIGSKTITSPSYIVSVDEEPFVTFSDKSALSNADHPERIFGSDIAKEAKDVKPKKAAKPKNEMKIVAEEAKE